MVFKKKKNFFTLLGKTDMFYVCCTLIYVHSSISIILMGKRELVALLNLSSWCLVVVGRLFLAVPRGCLQFVIVVFPDHTHLLLFMVLGKEVAIFDWECGQNSSPKEGQKICPVNQRVLRFSLF